MGASGYPPYIVTGRPASSSKRREQEDKEPAECAVDEFEAEPEHYPMHPVYVYGPPGPMGMPGASPSLEPACYTGWIDRDTDAEANIPLSYVGGPCLMNITDDTFLPVIVGRYLISVVAFVQCNAKFIVKLNLTSTLDLNIFGTSQVVTNDGDVISSTAVAGLNTNSPYSLKIRMQNLLTDSPNLNDTQRVSVNAYFMLI